MKVRFIIFSLFVLFSLSLAQQKYAYIDLIKVMNTSKEGLKLRKEIEEKFSYYKSKAKSIEEKIKQIKEQLKSPLLSEEAKKEKSKELEELTNQMQKITVEAQQTLNDMKKNAEIKLLKKIKLTVKEYSQKHNIDIVFFNAMVSPVLYADKSIDITDQIIKLMDKAKNESK